MNDEVRPALREANSLFDFLGVLRRRKLIIAQTVILVPAVAVFLSMRKPTLYEASAQVLISNQTGALASTLAGVPSIASSDPQYATTQAFLAYSPQVADLVVNAAKVPGLTADGFLGEASVAPLADTDLLKFTVVNNDPLLAIKLVNIYATQFTNYTEGLDTRAVQQAIDAVTNQMNEIPLAARTGAQQSLYSTLVGRKQTLQTVETLQKQNAYLARQAGGAHIIQPQPRRDGILGLFLGIVLGVALAFLREALDTRIRTAEEVSQRLGLPILGRIVPPSKRLQANFDLELLADPRSLNSESFRMLRTSVELANVGRNARVILVTSGIEQEGKTTTISNLAVALARAGRHVILVDLDLRRPAVERFFGLEDRVGLTDVALGNTTLDLALRPAALGEFEDSVSAPGSLHILPAGPLPPDPGEWVGNNIVGELLNECAARADIVLVDSPPLLHVGDAMALSPFVDAMIILVRLSLARRGTLTALRRLLESTPTPILGVVLTDPKKDRATDRDAYLPRAYIDSEESTLVR